MKKNNSQLQVNEADVGLLNYIRKHGYSSMTEIIPTGFYYARLSNATLISVHSFETAPMRDDHMKNCLLTDYQYCPVSVKICDYLNIDLWWGFFRFETGRIEHIYQSKQRAIICWKNPISLVELGVGDFVQVMVYNQELQCLTV